MGITAEEFEMGHAPEVSAQCLIGKCGACPDPDCECACHPVIRLLRTHEERT